MVSVGPLLVSGWSKECEDVGGLLLQGPSEGSGLGQAGWDSMGEFGDQGLHLGLARGGVGFAVGGDHLLVDVLGGLDLDMVIVGEQRLEGGLVVARSVVRCWCGGGGGPGTGDRRPGRGAWGVLVGRGAGIGPGRPWRGGRCGMGPSPLSRSGVSRWRRS